jgi:DNA-binding NarL/FixJ family response regulator
MTLRVVVADDDADVRSAIASVLDADERYTVVAQLDSGTAVVDTVSDHRADLLVLDVRMPAGGLTAVHALRDAGSGVVIVVVSARLDEALVADLLESEVRGVLLKGRLGWSLPDVLHRCSRGEVVVSG